MLLREINFIMEIVRIALALVLLSFASFRDAKTREVEDQIWAIMMLCGLIIFLLQTFLFLNTRIISYAIISVTVSFLMAVTLFSFGLFGGADGKALIGIAFMFPYPFSSIYPKSFLIPIFPIVVFFNALILTIVFPIFFVFLNSIDLIRYKKTIFRGLEHEPIYKKIILFITCCRIRINGSKKNFYPIVSLEKREDGSLKQVINLFDRDRVNKDRDVENLIEFYGENALDEKIWVTYGIPLIIPITLGLIFAITIGDLFHMIIVGIKFGDLVHDFVTNILFDVMNVINT